MIGLRAISAGPYSIRARAAPLGMRVPVLRPEHAAPPSLPPAAPLPSTPSAAAHHGLVRALRRYYERVRLLIRSLADCPLGLPPRPGIASATAGRMRSPRFRRDPFVREVALDPGRASAPRMTAPHMLPSTDINGSAPAKFSLSWLNPTPHTIAVYASPLPSPTDAQHSLAGGRYPLPAPDFHRLDRASFAWRTIPPC